MVFWRKKRREGEQEQEEQDNELLHPSNESEMEPPVEYDSDIDADIKQSLRESAEDIIEELDEQPAPSRTAAVNKDQADLRVDHTEEGGWLSRLTKGLSKSSNKIGDNITSVFTKRKLDQDALNELEDILIMADIGPTTAAKLVEDFSQERFDKEITPLEIRKALAGQMADVLEPVAQPLDITTADKKPFVMLVCGVNGAGKTTTIGKLAHE